MKPDKILIEFVEFVAPFLPSIRELALKFWKLHPLDLGKPPPSIAKWDAFDREFDAKRTAAKRK